MKRLLISVAALCFSVPAWAGDGAAFEALGFSKDGKVFVFEEYGTQDGSGRPYSAIHALDLETNRETEGFPVKSKPGEAVEGEGIDYDARGETRASAKAAIEKLELKQGSIIALNGAAAISEELLPMHVYPAMKGDLQALSFWSPNFGGDLKIEVTSERKPEASCNDIQPEGVVKPELRLSMNAEVKSSYADPADPRDFGCPEQYAISAVYVFNDYRSPARIVAVTSLYPLGFEGPDRRFRAFSLEVPERPK